MKKKKKIIKLWIESDTDLNLIPYDDGLDFEEADCFIPTKTKAEMIELINAHANDNAYEGKKPHPVRLTITLEKG